MYKSKMTFSSMKLHLCWRPTVRPTDRPTDIVTKLRPTTHRLNDRPTSWKVKFFELNFSSDIFRATFFGRHFSGLRPTDWPTDRTTDRPTDRPTSWNKWSFFSEIFRVKFFAGRINQVAVRTWRGYLISQWRLTGPNFHRFGNKLGSNVIAWDIGPNVNQQNFRFQEKLVALTRPTNFLSTQGKPGEMLSPQENLST